MAFPATNEKIYNSYQPGYIKSIVVKLNSVVVCEQQYDFHAFDKQGRQVGRHYVIIESTCRRRGDDESNGNWSILTIDFSEKVYRIISRKTKNGKAWGPYSSPECDSKMFVCLEDAQDCIDADVADREKIEVKKSA